MDVAEVDPRDTQWDQDAHRCRVYFWLRDGGSCTEYELIDAPGVDTVLAWAEEQSDGRVAEVFAYLVGDGTPAPRTPRREPPQHLVGGSSERQPPLARRD